MKKLSSFFVALVIAVGTLCAQSTRSHIQQIDNAAASVARELNIKLTAEKAQNVAAGQFVFRGSVTPFSDYWANQITQELTNVRNRSFTLVSGRMPEWTIAGEVIVVGDIIRVYTRLVRRSDQAVIAVINTDLDRDERILMMLSSGSGEHSVMYDEWEPDSWNNPVAYEIADAGNVPPMNRTLHSTIDGEAGDEDFFLLLPRASGWVIMETVGDTDTYMELYDADTYALLAEDDDSGSNTNARIRHNLQSGRRYIVKVRGYSPDITGHYGFRAYSRNQDWSNAIEHAIDSDAGSARVVQRRLGYEGNDLFLLRPGRSGTLVVETTGDTDTYMELYDADTRELLAEDDDSGSDLNARIEYSVQVGKRYIALVRGYSAESTGSYGFRAFFR
ncbi:MAG: hypothetical protein FWE10_04200 [Rikenellaceae bacterium]|nr:hypothetical protein [Rikenellaceae bacterium]MCL2692927.1 hypothetical protein [Rikenellaceae bacterium]